MKKICFTLFAAMMSLSLFSQGTEFRHISYEEALELARKENKTVFIDIYTSWCGPCKNLADEVFPKQEVGDVFNANFICAKFDAEKNDDGIAIARMFKVTAYPTLLFVNGDGELIYKFLGSRDVPGIIKEADNAIKAYANYPNIKKFQAEYNNGNRSKEFLNKYFDNLNQAGLDGSNILIEYFGLLTDGEIILPENCKKIEKITVLNENLADRLINIAIKEWKAGTMDKKEFAALNNGIGKLLSNCLSAAGAKDDPTDFEKVLELKKKFFTIDSNRNSIFLASMGGGSLYVPSEISAMDYYYKKGMYDKFESAYESFLNIVRTDYEKNKDAKEQMAKAMADKLEEAIRAGDTETSNAIKKSAGLMNILQGLDSHYNAVALINNADKYVGHYKGVKDKYFDKQIIDNYIFFNEFYPSCKNASHIAETLLSLNRKDAARQVLELALAKGSTAVEVNDEVIEKCRNLLEEAKK